MSHVLNVLANLQDMLQKKYSAGTEAQFSVGFGNNYKTGEPDELDTDLPTAISGDLYKTHRQLVVPKTNLKKKSLMFGEQEEVEEPIEGEEEEIPEEEPVEGREEIPEEGEEPMEGGEEDMGGDDMGMGGMPGEEEPKTKKELGRIYELKKIYSRLTAIESYLSNESDKDLLKVRVYVSQAIELFEVISSNFESYKDKLDDIIVLYYKFIKETYDIVKKQYKKISNKNKNLNEELVQEFIITPTIIALSTVAYKKYLSKIAKQCSMYKGEEKKDCINKGYIDASKIKINNLKKNLNQCKKTKNEINCIKSIKNKIKKEEIKLQKLKEK